jgi:hypothetical protein
LLKALRDQRAKAKIKVLTTEFNQAWSKWPDREDRPALGQAVVAYGYVGALGHPWQYLLDLDVNRIEPGDTVIVATPAISRHVLQQLSRLPEGCRLIIVGQTPPTNDWGQPHDPADIKAFFNHGVVIDSWDQLASQVKPMQGLPEAMGQVQWVNCWGYSKFFKQFAYTTPTPVLELRYADWRGGKVLAVINHSDSKTIISKLPWMNSVSSRCQVRWNTGITQLADNRFEFAPEAVG